MTRAILIALVCAATPAFAQHAEKRWVVTLT